MSTDIYFLITATLCIVIIVLITVFSLCIATTINNFRKTVSQKYITVDLKVSKLISLATDVWRLNKILQKIEGQLSKDDNQRIKNTLNRINAYLESNAIEVEDFTGRKPNDGMNIEVLNVEYSDNVNNPIISQTSKPQVSYTGTIQQKAQVIITMPPQSIPSKKDRKAKRRRHVKKSKNS